MINAEDIDRMTEWMIEMGDMLSTLSVEGLAVVALLAAAAGIGALLWLRALVNRVIDWLGCEEVYDAEWMDTRAWKETSTQPAVLKAPLRKGHHRRARG